MRAASGFGLRDREPRQGKSTQEEYSILGENVRGARGGSKSEYHRLSGSPVATMIAAGVAALLLQYGHYPRRGSLTLEIIQKLFAAMVDPSSKNHDRSLNPQRLFMHWTDNQDLFKSIISSPKGNNGFYSANYR
jgi:hypothetical protein